jgi:uncharacterized membrane protein YraQ (UPF0718 family)
MSAFLDFLVGVLRSIVNMLNSASVWMLLSFAIAGIFHELLDVERLRKSSFCSTKASGVFYSTVTGMLIPVCSCGSVPLGIGLYYSGAYLGPTLAFMTASPMINPVSIILAYGLLGKEIATVYVITGFVVPMIIGLVANRFAGGELYYQSSDDGGQRLNIKAVKPTLPQRIKSGAYWAFGDMAMMVSKYMVGGMVLAGLILSIVPNVYIQRYMGEPGLISQLGITLVATLMYVCAVGHIPFIAAIVASGAAPGLAIIFLMAGAATNFSELITINRTIGKRSMLMYFSMVVVLSNVVGYITNRLFPNFKPALNFEETTHSISAANHLIISAPEWLRYVCSSVLVGYAVWSVVKYIRKKLR